MTVRTNPYNRPPIKEAVIDIHTTAPAKRAAVEKAASRLKSEYPSSDIEQMIEFQVDRGVAKKPEPKWSGLKLSSADRADVLVLRPGSFTCSRLAPYQGWEDLIDKARCGWNQWWKARAATAIGRVGVRFINRLDIPMSKGDAIDVDEYLSVSVKIPEMGWGNATNYALQVDLPLRKGGFNLILKSGSVVPPLIDHYSLLLDIDLYRTESLPQREDELWALLDSVRRRKNEVFESIITDKSRELFNQ